MDERPGDAVRGLRRIAVLQAPEAPLHRDPSLLDPFQEPVPYGPSRHSHRALYDHDVLFLRIQIRLLIGRIRVTFLCGHETGRHLDAVGPQTELAQHVLMVKDPSGRHHRDLLFILSGKLLHHADDAADLRFILLSFIRF